MAELTTQAQALNAAIEAIDLGDLEDIAETLDSRTLRRIHKQLTESLERAQEALGHLEEAMEALGE